MEIAVALISPKFPHNIGASVRAVSCYATKGTVLYTGDRVDLGNRLPREERMKAYANVDWRHSTRPFDELPHLIPVAIELLPSSEPLHTFEHPENALYVFGPEDGSLPKGARTMCHRFVSIPSFHCLNLGAAVYVTLYDRALKRWQNGLGDMPSLDGEQRGWWHSPALEDGAFAR